MPYSLKHIVLVSSVIASAMLCGCDKEVESLPSASMEQTFKVEASMSEIISTQTKSGDSQTFVLSNEEGSMSLGMTCEQAAMESGPVTKANNTAIMNLDALKEQGFNMKVWSPSASVFDGSVTWESNAWKIGDGTDIIWPTNTAYTVYAYANAGGLTPAYVEQDDKGVGFSWRIGADNTDVIVAKYSGNGSNGVAPLTFIHPLASVSFQIDGDCTDLSVSEIAIEGVIYKGHYTYSSTGSAWDEIAEDNISKTFDTPATSGELLKYYFAPQTFGTGDDKITVKITTSDSQVLKCDLTSGGWSEGNSYTYKISKGTTPTPPTTDKIIVTVADQVSGNVKNNVVISNSSESTQKCYIRATITGGWFDSTTGSLVQNWYVNTSSTGSNGFTGLTCDITGNKGDWIFNANDGFWYFNVPVAAGSSTDNPLFTSFTLPETSHPEDSHFEMKIIVQGVIWDAEKTNVANAWGTDVANLLNAN